jgi:hypothetical protein
LPGGQKVDASGADVAGDEGYWKLLRHSANAAKSQGKVQTRARVLPVLRVYAYGVRGHADESARLRRA